MNNPGRQIVASAAIWMKGLACGLTGGIVLAIFLKLAELGSGHKVYRLLLNVDFISLMPPRLPEWFELTLHLIVSLAIGLIYAAWIMFRSKPAPLTSALWIGFLSSLLYFPLASLSDRVPAPGDMKSFGWWLAGHLFFGMVLFGSNRILNPLIGTNRSPKA